MTSDLARNLTVIAFLVGLPTVIIGATSVFTSYDLVDRLLSALVAVVAAVAVAWSVWRDTVVIAKVALVTMLFLTAFSAFAFLSPGIPWPFIASLSVLVGCLVWYLAPPGRTLPHRLLDRKGEVVFDAEGVQFTISTPPSARRMQPLEVELTAENCWTAHRDLEVCLGTFRSSMTLEPGELKQTRLVLPADQLVDRRGNRLTMTFDVRALGWRGRRDRPRRGLAVSRRIRPSETAGLLLFGIVAWGGGVRITTRLE